MWGKKVHEHRQFPLYPRAASIDQFSDRCCGIRGFVAAIGAGPGLYNMREITTMPHMVFCSRYKQEMEGLDEPPFDSDFGNKVYNNVSKKSWQEWIERQKMLLNEYRLQPWTPQAQEFLVEQMDQFFFGEGAALPKEYVPPSH